jgi:ABC-type branched-subunit amino acid transport system substrate-binding protein
MHDRSSSFVQRYRQRYKIPLQTDAPYAYDAVMVFAKAMQTANSTPTARDRRRSCRCCAKQRPQSWGQNVRPLIYLVARAPG